MRPKRNDLCLGHVGPRAVTVAERVCAKRRETAVRPLTARVT